MLESEKSPRPASSRTIFWVVLLTIAHSFIWFTHYGQTVLGESPALDNRQTLLLAEQIANHTLPPEPFHRAPLYPYILSLFLTAGLPNTLLPLIARLLNGIALATIAGTSASIAQRLWKRPAAAWFTGLLIGLNPVLLFFAGDAFDILLAAAVFTLSLQQLQTWLACPDSKRSFTIGLLLAISAALRSHLLPLALLWPITCVFLTKRHRLQHAAIASIGPLLGFLLLGFANLKVADEFRVLPWQGAYNLWAGNKPDANGRIYAQTIRVQFGNEYDNPAKLESIALYGSETGLSEPYSISAMNHHWTNKFFTHIAQNPADWLGLMLRKAYYFLNSYEQYDNKTYSFHKAQHAQLRLNPIHWGALLVLAVAGTLIGLRQPEQRKCLIAFIIIFAAYAAGTILFYTSNRFRLPMLPILAILSPGILLLPQIWRESQKLWRATLLLCIALTAAIAYSNAFDARNTNTWEEDRALLANASLRTGRDQDAIDWAQKALQTSPARPDMLSVIAQATFNQWALDPQAAPPSYQTTQTLLANATTAGLHNIELIPIIGIYHWKLGDQQTALQLWSDHAPNQAFARLCLFWTNATPPPTAEEISLYPAKKDNNLLIQAIRAKSGPENAPIKQLFNRMFEPLEPE